ncbi:MAG: aldehyde dehydrogenase (NADP(+)) [Paracoccaceae bacterium]
MLNGKSLIAGNWETGGAVFTSDPVHGQSREFSAGTVEQVSAACEAAEAAFWSYGQSSRKTRADFLNAIADEIDLRADQITEIGTQETGLPEARLQGERGRTTGQLRLFATHIMLGTYLDRRHDPALPDRTPLPRPEMRMMMRPLGPVAVFGDSNFPLAFSTAGGDTAAALAAGCPVIVKGHPAHPGTGEIIAKAIDTARKRFDLHAGIFSFVQDGGQEIGATLVQHPLINAVGFTGSQAGGRALFDLCAARLNPIPFFGELGSINPMFILPGAAATRLTKIGAGWAASLTMGAGQFCTNPGVAIIHKDVAEAFAETAGAALAEIQPQSMLTTGIAAAFSDGKAVVENSKGVDTVLSSANPGRKASPQLFATDADTWLANANLSHEVFGPLGIVVSVDNLDQMLEVAHGLKGQLTCTLHMEDKDHETAQNLLPILERKAGRILANGFPTGVEVSDSMVHGGPYPASTNFGATSVGTLSIRRFLRPVCYQNLPAAIMPSDLLNFDPT